MELKITNKTLCTEPQSMNLTKLATLIGENGSGKSTILRTIFDEGLKNKGFNNHKLVCFSSGQNENFSELFGDYLNSERRANKSLSLDCFYYDKSWSKLVIFLATATKQNGFVRGFLLKHGYIDVSEEFSEDITTELSIKVKVDSAYISRVKMAIEDEIKGNPDTLVSSPYHRTLESFIDVKIPDDFDFEQPLSPVEITLMESDFSRISFENDDSSYFDPIVTFFTQAADNNYFIIKDTLLLRFKHGIELNDLSDGEYQILFLYALLDLLDSENTLFLLDEADSHLHYKNLEHFWSVLRGIQGKAITTTHLLDSISNSGIENIKIVNSGKIYSPEESNELVKRFETLSNILEAKLKILSFYENVVLMDNENDWEIFKLLVKRKLGNTQEKMEAIDDSFKKFAIVGKESGWDSHTSTLAKSKNLWVENFKAFVNGYHAKTKNIFLLCDRDNLPLTSIGNDKCTLLVNDSGLNKFEKREPFQTHVLAWKRREIKHYLLSYSALGEKRDALNNFDVLTRPAFLYQNCSGDYLQKLDDGNLYTALVELEKGHKEKRVRYLIPEYNDSLASLSSNTVKPILANFIEQHIEEPKGFNLKMANSFVNDIPACEISEDIVEMYKFLVGKND